MPVSLPHEEAQLRANEIARLGLTGQMFVTMSWGCEYCNSFDVEPTEEPVDVGTIITMALNLIGAVSKLPGIEKSAVKYSIKWLQESLNSLVDAGLKVDGDYGPATKAAVKKFQQQFGLTVDGWAGAITQSAIVDALK